MDWTGGARRRLMSRGGRDPILQRQKAYFAKPREINLKKQHSQQHAEPAITRRLTPRSSYSVLPSCQRGWYDDVNARSSRTERPDLDDEIIEDEESFMRRKTQSSRVDGDQFLHEYRQTSSKINPLESNPDLQPSQRSSAPFESPLTMSDLNREETAMKVTRQQLLDRSDWLGLNAARPLRMTFPTARHEEKIGRRRKVQVSATRSGKVIDRKQHRSFENGSPPFEPLMSGALPPEDIQVKVGTQVPRSRTESSRYADNALITSIRQLGALSSALTEESMLLGEEAFESTPGYFNVSSDQIGAEYNPMSGSNQYKENHELLRPSSRASRQSRPKGSTRFSGAVKETNLKFPSRTTLDRGASRPRLTSSNQPSTVGNLRDERKRRKVHDNENNSDSESHGYVFKALQESRDNQNCEISDKLTSNTYNARADVSVVAKCSSSGSEDECYPSCQSPQAGLVAQRVEDVYGSSSSIEVIKDGSATLKSPIRLRKGQLDGQSANLELRRSSNKAQFQTRPSKLPNQLLYSPSSGVMVETSDPISNEATTGSSIFMPQSRRLGLARVVHKLERLESVSDLPSEGEDHLSLIGYATTAEINDISMTKKAFYRQMPGQTRELHEHLVPSPSQTYLKRSHEYDNYCAQRNTRRLQPSAMRRSVYDLSESG